MHHLKIAAHFSRFNFDAQNRHSFSNSGPQQQQQQQQQQRQQQRTGLFSGSGSIQLSMASPHTLLLEQGLKINQSDNLS